MYALSW